MSKLPSYEQLFYDEFATFFEGIKADLNSVATAPTSALRTAGGSRRSMGGSMLFGSNRIEVKFDSNLERRWILQFVADGSVIAIEVQAVRTPYRKGKDAFSSTIWDILVTYDDGRRKLVSVKPFSVAASEDFKPLWKAICEDIPPGTAHEAQLCTEHELDPIKVDRGNMFNIALTHDRPEWSEQAYKFIAAQEREVTIERVCAHLRALSPVPHLDHFLALSKEFWAVVWLLAKRVVRLCSDDYLGMNSVVTLS